MTAAQIIVQGVQVSPLGFGGAPIGNLYAKVTEAEAQAALATALAQGIRYFDTAPFYGHGLSEKRMGRALAGQPRDSYVLSTKVGRLMSREPRGTRAAGTSSVSRALARSSITAATAWSALSRRVSSASALAASTSSFFTTSAD